MREEQQNKIPGITIILVIINVLVYAYVEWNGSSYDTEYMIKMGALWEPLILEGHEYYRLITHFFLHFGFEHLVNNMISLLVLGYAVEQVLGKVRYIILYFLSGILAGVTSIVYNVVVGNEYTVSCGASGAIYGLTGALLMLLILGNKGRRTSEVPRYLLFIGLSLYSGMVDTSIDNAAHIGGLITGFVICLIMTRKKRMEVSYES
ncbi:MAG: rhomboid family intramembrane serine protease [Lachnospiraceae bacterium]|nr:rhomboid family intramembrane serine protease [Lachnospiraceae bacterium]